MSGIPGFSWLHAPEIESTEEQTPEEAQSVVRVIPVDETSPLDADKAQSSDAEEEPGEHGLPLAKRVPPGHGESATGPAGRNIV